MRSSAVTFRQFEYFVGVVQLGSMSAAARKFGVSPSAMSQQMGVLEDSLGHKLFGAGARRSGLTKFGREFYKHASNILDSVDQAISIGEQFPDGMITVGTTPTLANKMLPSLIQRMPHRRGVNAIEIRSFCDMRALSSALDSGAVDLALGPLRRSSAKFVHVIGDEELVVACPPNQEGRLRGSWDRLAEMPWIRCAPSSDITDLVDREARRAGVRIRYAVTAPDVTAALNLVAHRVGVALVPLMSLSESSRAVTAIRLESPLQRSILAHATEMTPTVEELMRILTEAVLPRPVEPTRLCAV
ncbi:LysR family transcriptional regulator [Nocardia arthritidis]|uniref:LysR family transcriptional regulator n=1 Tax=Nocardia arthritidis TaxID=228602 RepID=UPI00142E3AC2|nr:LysR family transcriptional regulator [Nocardia arthritidis]